MEPSHFDLSLPHETGQPCGEEPVHPHDKEVCEDVGEGEVERDQVPPGAGCQGGEAGSVAVLLVQLPPQASQVGPHHLQHVLEVATVELRVAGELAGGVELVGVGELSGGHRHLAGGGGGALSVSAEPSSRRS